MQSESQGFGGFGSFRRPKKVSSSSSSSSLRHRPRVSTCTTRRHTYTAGRDRGWLQAASYRWCPLSVCPEAHTLCVSHFSASLATNKRTNNGAREARDWKDGERVKVQRERSSEKEGGNFLSAGSSNHVWERQIWQRRVQLVFRGRKEGRQPLRLSVWSGQVAVGCQRLRRNPALLFLQPTDAST